MVLLILAALWAVVLVPPLLRARVERTGDTIGDFNNHLDVLGRTNGTLRRAHARGGRRVSAAKRRRDVLRTLAGAAALTLLLAFVGGAPLLWALHLAADGLLAAYLGLWAWVRSTPADRTETVQYLPSRAPELALRRTGSS